MNDLAVVAELWARCSLHPLTGLVKWVLCEDGQVRREVLPGGDGWAEENAPDPGGSESHLREVVRCTRPSCNYRAELGPAGTSQVEELLRRMRSANRAHQVVELNEFLRDPAREFSTLTARG